MAFKRPVWDEKCRKKRVRNGQSQAVYHFFGFSVFCCRSRYHSYIWQKNSCFLVFCAHNDILFLKGLWWTCFSANCASFCSPSCLLVRSGMPQAVRDHKAIDGFFKKTNFMETAPFPRTLAANSLTDLRVHGTGKVASSGYLYLRAISVGWLKCVVFDSMILLVYTHTDWNMWKLSVRCSSVSYVWLTKKSQKTLHLVSSQQAILDKTASFVDRKQLFSWKPVYRSMSKFVFSQFSKVKKLETGIIYVIKTVKKCIFLEIHDFLDIRNFTYMTESSHLFGGI